MKKPFTLLIILLGIISLPNLAYSQAGTLDVTFSDDGIALFTPGDVHDNAWDMAALDDTTMLLCGTAKLNGSGGATSGILMKVLNDGSQDMSWGTDGVVELQYGTDTYAYDMLFQPDGKILVSGICYVTASDGEAFVARFNPNGTPDPTFNSTGYFLSSYSVYEETCDAMALQTDGKIILAGQTYLGSFSQMLFMRVNSNGTIDNSFGTGGYTEINSSVQGERINDLGILSNGTIVGLGYGYLNSPWWGEKVHMAKLTSSGAPMPGFGLDGVIIPDIFYDISVAYKIAVINDSILLPARSVWL